jgi:hypothetical protein
VGDIVKYLKAQNRLDQAVKKLVEAYQADQTTKQTGLYEFTHFFAIRTAARVVALTYVEMEACGDPYKGRPPVKRAI